MSYLKKEADDVNDIVNLFKSFFPSTYNLNTVNLPNIKYPKNILDLIFCSINKHLFKTSPDFCNFFKINALLF